MLNVSFPISEHFLIFRISKFSINFGHTGKLLEQRLKEHKANIRHGRGELGPL